MKHLRATAASAALATVFAVGVTGTTQAATLVGNTDTTSSSKEIASEFGKPVSQDFARKLQATLDKTVQESGPPGAVVGIVSPQGTWFGASGVSNLETGTAMQIDNLFFNGSITKTFTAATVLKLQEQGKLSLDDTLGEWLPEIAKAIPDGNTITVRQLMNGSAGIYDFSQDVDLEVAKDPSILLSRDWQPEDAIAYAYGKPRYTGRTCTPVWCYTNTSSLIAELIVEKATNSTFGSVVRNQVLEPLGLNHTFIAGEEEIPGQLVQGYQDINGDGNLDDVTVYDLAVMRAAGGNVTINARDLIRFSQGLFGGELLKPESLNELLTFVQTGTQTPTSTFGLGVENLPSPWGGTLGKGGTSLGNESQMTYFTDNGITGVALVNAVNVQGVSIYDVLNANVNTFVTQGNGDNSRSVPEPSAIGGLMAMGAGFLIIRKRHLRAIKTIP